MGVDNKAPVAWSTDLQRVALWVVIASVAAAALMGVFALLVGDFGETQGRILGTTAFILATSLLVMATTPAVTRRWLTPLPEIGIALAVGGFALLTIAIWIDEPPDDLLKVSGILIIWAVAVAHASLLSAARLEDTFAWTLWVAYASASVLALIFSYAVVTDFEGGDAFGRLVGVVAIVVASSSIAVPVFHRMSQLEEVEIDFGTRDLDRPSFSYCPSCGARIRAREPGELMACPMCQARTIVLLADDESAGGTAPAGSGSGDAESSGRAGSED